MPGEIFHTIRFGSSIPWQNWKPVRKLAAYDPGPFRQAVCAAIGNDLHVLGIRPGGELYHTIRFPNSWQDWEPVSQAAANFPTTGTLSDVACAGIGNDLHVIGIQVGGDLYHTIRFGSSNSWQDWEPVSKHAAYTPNMAFFPRCASVGNDLHVLAIVYGNLYHTIRYSNGKWQDWHNASAEVPKDPGSFLFETCAGIGNDLHVVASNAGELYHTIRFASLYKWQDWKPVSTQAANNPGYIYNGDCAAIGNDLHIVAASLDQLYHTIRFASSIPWQDWKNVSQAATYYPAPATGYWIVLSCAAIGNDLHIIGIMVPEA
jgi:hypothetical protein